MIWASPGNTPPDMFDDEVPPPSNDCTTCAANCVGGDISAVFTTTGAGGCAFPSGPYTLSYIAGCQWKFDDGVYRISLDCVANAWYLYAEIIGINGVYRDLSPQLVCGGDHPTGSGTLTGTIGEPCEGQTGTWSFA